MNSRFLAVVAWVGLILSSHAQGSEIERHFSSRLENVWDATRELVKAKRELEHGDRWSAHWKMQSAAWKLSFARFQLNSLGTPEALEPIQVAREKLEDRYLGMYEKVDIALDCLSQALRIYVEESQAGTKAAVSHLRLAMYWANYELKDFARNSLKEARYAVSDLRRFEEGLEAIEVALEKLDDPYLTVEEQKSFVKDCASIAIRLLSSGGSGGGRQVSASCKLDVGGNWLFPKSSFNCQVFGRGVKGYVITVNGRTVWRGHLDPHKDKQTFHSGKKKVGGHSVEYEVFVETRRGEVSVGRF